MRDLRRVLDVLRFAGERGVRVVEEPTAKDLLVGLGFVVPEGRVVASVSDARELAEELGPPLMVKAVLPDVSHKSEIGALRGPLASARDVGEAADLLITAHGAPILVERWVAGGIECFLGLTLDGAHGPVVSAGLGGIWVELFRDVAHRAAPVSEQEAREMIGALRAAPVIEGTRGRPGAHVDRLAGAIARLSRLALEDAARSLIAEVDINPLLARPDGSPVALDCTVVLQQPLPPAAEDVEGSSGHRERVAVQRRRDLQPLLEPASVAIIGASQDAGKPGGVLLRNLVDGGFDGRIYPINPRAETVGTLPAYPRMADVPEAVDLAFIAIRREHVRQAVHDCGEASTRAVVIVSAGFGESDEWGRQEQREIAGLLRKYGMLGIGPNTIGLVTKGGRLRGSFVQFPEWQGGPIGIVAQSGIFAGAVADDEMARPTQRPGIHASIGIGNRIDVDERDFLEAFAVIPEIRVIGLYLESFADFRSFLAEAARVKAEKPVILLKSARTRSGMLAAASHTGALGQDEELVAQLLAQHGVVRAEDEEDFLALLRGFAQAPAPRGPRLGIVTFSGALGVLASDLATELGLELPPYSDRTLVELAGFLPDWQQPKNPADLWPAVDTNPRDALVGGLRAALSDPAFDQVLGILLAVSNAHFDELQEAVQELRAEVRLKPLHLVIRGRLREQWSGAFDRLEVPVHGSVRKAVRAMSAATWHARIRNVSPQAHQARHREEQGVATCGWA